MSRGMEALDGFIRAMDGDLDDELGAWVSIRPGAGEGLYEAEVALDSGGLTEWFVIEVRPAAEVADAQP